jgi:hypothetical protein
MRDPFILYKSKSSTRGYFPSEELKIIEESTFTPQRLGYPRLIHFLLLHRILMAKYKIKKISNRFWHGSNDETRKETQRQIHLIPKAQKIIDKYLIEIIALF